MDEVIGITDVLLTVLKILIAILVFGLIIFIHELGHFFMARLMGVKVNEFAIGMGPQLFHFGKKETKYSLRALPVGGYCAMEGEDSDSPDPRAFGQKKVWRRILIVIAGALMNLVLGMCCWWCITVCLRSRKQGRPPPAFPALPSPSCRKRLRVTRQGCA